MSFSIYASDLQTVCSEEGALKNHNKLLLGTLYYLKIATRFTKRIIYFQSTSLNFFATTYV